MQEEIKNAAKNTSMLYLMNIAKMIFPLLTLPYLTRVLSVDCYAVVAYIKATMQYMQIFLAFGFTLSATKEIVQAKNNIGKINEITSEVMEAKGILSLAAMTLLIGITVFIPILRENPFYVCLAFINAVITEMLADFLFRGLDKMDVITLRFVISKTISTLMTFIFVKNDSQIILIPVFDILGSSVAFLTVFFEMKKMGIRFVFIRLPQAFRQLKESSVYFFSEIASTAFGAFNTFLIGIYLPRQDVSYWSICMQPVSAVLSMYSPVSNGIYSTMIRTKSLKFLKKILLIFMPIITAGCVFCFFAAEMVLSIIGGAQYISAVNVFRAMIPIMFFCFPVVILGWPALGAINKQKEVSQTTIITAALQVGGLFLLRLSGHFDLISIALLRGATEFCMLLMRLRYVLKFKSEFN